MSQLSNNLIDIINADDFENLDERPRRPSHPSLFSKTTPAVPGRANKYRVSKCVRHRTLQSRQLALLPEMLAMLPKSPRKQEKINPFLLTRLNQDCRFQIFDAIIDQESTIFIVPGLQPNGLLKSLSQTCHQLKNELQQWSKTRPDLVQSQIFGLYNPMLTSFDMCYMEPFSQYERRRLPSILHRIYHPAAAFKNIDYIERVQETMNNTLILGGEKFRERIERTGLRFRGKQNPYDRSRINHNSTYAIDMDARWPVDFDQSLEVDVELSQHLADGVKDELVWDRKKYGNLKGALESMSPWAQYQQDEGKLSFVWTDDWDGFLEHRRIIECED